MTMPPDKRAAIELLLGTQAAVTEINRGFDILNGGIYRLIYIFDEMGWAMDSKSVEMILDKISKQIADVKKGYDNVINELHTELFGEGIVVPEKEEENDFDSPEYDPDMYPEL